VTEQNQATQVLQKWSDEQKLKTIWVSKPGNQLQYVYQNSTFVSDKILAQNLRVVLDVWVR